MSCDSGPQLLVIGGKASAAMVIASRYDRTYASSRRGNGLKHNFQSGDVDLGFGICAFMLTLIGQEVSIELSSSLEGSERSVAFAISVGQSFMYRWRTVGA
jgi:hypothetical protein